MTRSPHDLADLYLAPVVLAVDARIRLLGVPAVVRRFVGGDLPLAGAAGY